jgi:monodechloroaminopyrrolnitrin synthase
MTGSLWLGDINHAAIGKLDPLSLDATFRQLPEINRAGDERVLGDLVDTAVARVEPTSLSVWGALAAMRDIGMLIASLRRLSGPYLRLPAPTTATLAQLGRITDMPPRETVLHYCSWNPEGPRRRVFTGDPEEHALISTTARCLDSFENAARVLLDLSRDHPTSPSYARACRWAARELANAALSVHGREGRLDPHHFATTLRAYFEPVEINGRSYNAAAAAQAPLYLVDELVFGREAGDATLWSLRDELAEYGLPRWRRAYKEARQGPSVVESIAAVSRSTARQSTRARDAVDAVRELLRQLVSFRGRHRRLVAAAYKHTAHGFDGGSAGADLHLIDSLLGATRSRYQEVVDMQVTDTTGALYTAIYSSEQEGTAVSRS